MSAPEAPLLRVEDLHVTYDTPTGLVRAVSGVSFELGREKLGIVGESGSGKSQTGRAILGLTAPGGQVHAQRMEFEGTDLLTADERTMRRIRGAGISMIMQDPKYSLNPVMTVGAQIQEAFLVHRKTSKQEARARTLDMLRAVKIREPERVYKAYPHEVSGGMGQRIMIAMMMIPEPDIIIADEPTSALDVTVQLQVLAVLDDMIRERGMGLIFISHDLNLIASFCDRILIMYGGKVMEECAAADLDQAQHPYTRGLLNCLPSLEGGHDDLPVLQRDPSWLTSPGAPGVIEIQGLDVVFGHGRKSFMRYVTSRSRSSGASPMAWSASLARVKPPCYEPLRGCSVALPGLVARCGSQRSRCRASYARSSFAVVCKWYSRIPSVRCTPRHTVDTILSEPARVHRLDRIEQRVVHALEEVGLNASFRFRYPHQISGGQRQRVSIARALITDPEIILLDEPTSALDVSVQAEVLNLLMRLKREHGLTYILVSHNLAVIAHMCEVLIGDAKWRGSGNHECTAVA